MKNTFSPKRFEGVCEDLSSEGKGVVRYQQMVGFIENFLPGEKAIIEITFAKRDIFYGKIVERIERSPHRVTPKCRYIATCGGCSLQHLNYEQQLLYKQKKVEEDLKRIAGITVPVSKTVGMEEPYAYRNKIQVPFRTKKNGQIVSGFYQEKTHQIVAIESCLIEHPKASHILATIRDLMKEYRVQPYDEDTRSGVIRHVLIRTSHYKNEMMVVLVCNQESFPGRKDFIKYLIQREPEITTVVQNTNCRSTNVILGDREKILYGKGFILDTLCEIEFKISAKSFYQINPLQTEKLYRKAIELAKITNQDLVLDAYCGIGTIGLIAAKKAKEVIGVEIVKEAIQDAVKNARDNQIRNAQFYCEDAGEFLLKKKLEGINFDVVIMDPPRKGSDETFLSILLETKPKRIVYISCDPATLARDLKTLKKGYEIKEVIPFDMFPQTFHVETCVLLSHKNS